MTTAGCGSDPVPRDLGAREEAPRVQRALGLAYPYRIVKWGYYRDGGSIGILVHDRWGRRYRAFLRVPENRSVPTDTSKADTLRMDPRFFWAGGDEHMQAARKLSIGGPEELAILDMLDVISLDYFERPTRDSLVAFAVARHTDPEHLSEDERNAIRAAVLETSARVRDPRGMVVWIRGKGWQI